MDNRCVYKGRVHVLTGRVAISPTNKTRVFEVRPIGTKYDDNLPWVSLDEIYLIDANETVE